MSRDLAQLRLDYLEAAYLQLLDRLIAVEQAHAFEVGQRQALEQMLFSRGPAPKSPLKAELQRLRARARRAADPAEAAEDLQGGIDTEAELTRRVPR